MERKAYVQPTQEAGRKLLAREAFNLYISHTLPFLKQSNGEILFLGESQNFLIGPDDETERIYVVESTGFFDDDPNVTDKKFAGNPTNAFLASGARRIATNPNIFNSP